MGTMLGPWAATMSAEDDTGLVLAIDAGTYLTLALRPGDGSEFHESFVGALDNALGDLGVPKERIAVECEAVRPTSQWWPSGSTTRPGRQPQSFFTATTRRVCWTLSGAWLLSV